MLHHYLKLGLRSLLRQRGLTAINIMGLATSMAACILLLQYISYELSFDSFHKDADRIYRVVNARYQEGELVQKGAITYPTIGPALVQDYPEVELATRLTPTGIALVKPREKLYQVEQLFWVDEHFLDIFDFPVLAQATDSVLARSHQAVLTRSQAETWYGVSAGSYASILGQNLQTDQSERPFTIVAILEDFPANSHLQPDLLLSYASLPAMWGEGVLESWTWSDFYHYIRLAPNTEVAKLEAKFTDFSARYFRGAAVSGSEEVFTLQALLDAHLYSNDLEYELAVIANGKVVWALLLIACFILIIAWVNYTNLTSSRALERATAVGIQRVVGASRSQLVKQFLTEALMVNVAGLILAFCLAKLLGPLFQQLMAMPVSEIAVFATLRAFPALGLSLFGLIVGGLALSAFYPAWLLSSQRTATVLKGMLSRGRQAQGIRRGLLVFQFAVSIALIAGTLLVGEQLRYMQAQDLGLDIEQVIVIAPPRLTQWDSLFIGRTEALKGELLQLAGVSAVSTTSRVPGQNTGRLFEVQAKGAQTDRNHTFRFFQADHSYADVLELELVAGRYLQRDDYSPNWDDLHHIVINEKAARDLGWTDPVAAVGERLTVYDRDWTIVGVVADFHQLSLHHVIDPLLIQPTYGTNHHLMARVQTDELEQLIPQLQASYQDVFPGNDFSYTFLEERFAQQYVADQRFRSLLSGFTILAIIIACLGLSALAFYASYLRTKEIGIRKILGAAPGQLLLLLTKDFMWLVLLAIMIGLPLAWLGVGQWMDNFAYRAAPAWGLLVGVAVLGFVIAFLTVGIHALRRMAADPVDSLRYE